MNVFRNLQEDKMSKKIIYGIEAINGILNGLRKLEEAVRCTLGPKGRSVILQKSFGDPVITKDGVSVAKEIEFSDPLENIGAQLVKAVANNALNNAGDGTTTATVLAGGMAEVITMIQRAGVNQSEVVKGIMSARDAIIENISSMTKKIAGDFEAIKQVASVSANGDTNIGQLIADAMKQVGESGVITVEDGDSLHTTIEVVEGMQFDKGYISRHFVTNDLQCVLDDAFILLYDKKISSIQPILKILEEVAKTGKALLIIAEDVDGDALTTLVVNRLRGALKICCVKAPSFGDKRKAVMADIAILTGGHCISEDIGLTLENATLEHLGRAKKIKITSDDTTIVDGYGTKESVQTRCNEIKAEIFDSKSDYDKEKLQERLARLASGVAVIKVGGATEVELKEKKDRIDDALHAIRAAIEEGIVPGGGVALLRCVTILDNMKLPNTDQAMGCDIVKAAIRRPIEMIAENAGVCGPLVVQQVLASKEYAYGYDASKGVYGDMIEMGIIDPAKVVKQALIAACSIVSMLGSVGACVYSEPEKNKDTNSDSMGGPMGPMGGY
jgi:chaperonin GroEL